MTAVHPPEHAKPDFLSGGGEMGRLIRETDWSQTSLGPIESWSPALRTMVQFMLANRFPMLLWWGPDYVQTYNDPYRPIPGAKHPRQALGKPGRECWSEIWHIIGPLVDRPYSGGPSSWNEDILLEINRHGFLEESHFTIAYSPVPDESVPSGIGGVLATVHEITEKVVGERRVTALRDLGARALDAKSADEACAIIAETLARHDRDVAFAAIYLIDPATDEARLTGVAGVEPGAPVSPELIDLSAPGASGWPLSLVKRTGSMELVEDLQRRFNAVPQGPWSDAPHTAVIVPIPTSKAQEVAGFLIVGISSRLQFDAAYRDFLELLRTQVANIISNARAYEEEKRRAEALAALDRAKTQFFSNVSHEFRTPLTLMLGPIENLLANERATANAEVADQLDVVHRNSLRLLRLVNTMLEFTRIEAGRASANYEAVDLPALTAELASNFRSACEQAGLRLVVECPPLDTNEPAYVDRDMWEKVVLNLVSNAFKFTMSGEIAVRVEAVNGIAARLVVRDTGVGIPAEELPRMFERFHRIQNSRARTHEGTGIGLALVQELVKMHGGTIDVESELDVGSTFTVTIPLGRAHLTFINGDYAEPRVARSATRAFVEEALRWLPDAAPATVSTATAPSSRPRILWADDNADMRQYVAGLLGGLFDVESVADGQAALEAARRKAPDLVLADVMMPKLNGFELLQEVRATEGLEHVPVILVSARAGEESRIGGMQAGADDYLVKPFSARELVARVDAHVRLARTRRECELVRQKSEAQVNRLVEELRNADRHKDEFLATLAHELRNPLAPVRNAVAILNLKGSSDPELAWARGVIERQMDQMTRLVDDLLDVSRISRGKLELKRERIELARVIHGAVEASRPHMEQNAHELHVTLPTEAIHLHADETRLIQVFCNLLNNAAKYSESRGRIVLSVMRENGQAIVTVRDHGIGIPDEVLPRVFDMFTQADRAFERSKGGLGVGLTLVKQLVELHNGSVEARSEGPGRGSEFVVRLPLMAEAPEGRAQNTFTDREVSLMRQRVLIVDDNRDAADTLAMMLEIMGNEVRTAYDGMEALQVGSELRPDVVLLDIGLPGLNGYEAARRIRAEPWGSRSLLIALTGWGQSEDRRRSREAGFDHHVVKPVAAGTLMELLASSRASQLRAPMGSQPNVYPTQAEVADAR